MDRRNFIKSNAITATSIMGYSFFPDFLSKAGSSSDKKSYAAYLRKSTIPKEELDVFLNENSWAQFDPEVGYIMGNSDVDVKGLNRLAEILNAPAVDFTSEEGMQRSANDLKNKYSFKATRYILRKIKEFCRKRDKNLLLIHFDPYGVLRPMIRGEARYDQEVIDFIEENNYRFFDMTQVHAEDYKKFKISPEEYMQRYFIGHYNPSGNHFFAYALKDTLVDWLNPKPITYQQGDEKLIRFKEYLQE